MGDFFAFRKMLTLPLIWIVYVIGIVVITWGVFAQASQLTRVHSVLPMTPYGMPLVPGSTASVWLNAIVQLVVAQVVWRVVCEGVVIVFSIYESLKRIEERE